VLRSRLPETSDCDPVTLAAALGVEDVDTVRRLGAAAYLIVPLCARGQVLLRLLSLVKEVTKMLLPSQFLVSSFP